MDQNQLWNFFETTGDLGIYLKYKASRREADERQAVGIKSESLSGEQLTGSNAGHQ